MKENDYVRITVPSGALIGIGINLPDADTLCRSKRLRVIRTEYTNVYTPSRELIAYVECPEQLEADASGYNYFIFQRWLAPAAIAKKRRWGHETSTKRIL